MFAGHYFKETCKPRKPTMMNLILKAVSVMYKILVRLQSGGSGSELYNVVEHSTERAAFLFLKKVRGT